MPKLEKYTFQNSRIKPLQKYSKNGEIHVFFFKLLLNYQNFITAKEQIGWDSHFTSHTQIRGKKMSYARVMGI